jgi:hypothetical protein
MLIFHVTVWAGQWKKMFCYLLVLILDYDIDLDNDIEYQIC